MDRIGLGFAARRESGQSIYTLQIMLHYFKEAKEGDALSVSCRLLDTTTSGCVFGSIWSHRQAIARPPGSSS